MRRTHRQFGSIILTITGLIISITKSDSVFGFADLAQLSAPVEYGTVWTRTQETARKLESGRPIERELSGGEAHNYTLVLTANQYVYVVVDQRGIDVLVTLFNLEGKQLTSVDSPNGTKGLEPLKFVAESAGSYRLEVRSLDKTASPGRYEIKIAEIRPARDKDKVLVSAEWSFAQAEQLEASGVEAAQNAIAKFEEAIAGFRSISDTIKEGNALHELGLLYYRLGDYPKAIDSFQQALDRVRTSKDKTGEGKYLHSLGATYFASGDAQKAIELLKKALPIRIATSGSEDVAATLGILAQIYGEQGQNRAALDYALKELALQRELRIPEDLAKSLNLVGSLVTEMGELQEGTDYLEQALQVCRTACDVEGRAVLLINIGQNYSALGEKRKALDYFGQAIKLIEGSDKAAVEANAFHSRGTIYAYLGEKKNAVDDYNRALLLWRKSHNLRGEAYLLNLLGNEYLDSHDLAQAMQYFEQALTLCRQIHDQYGEAYALVKTALVYSNRGEEHRALNLLNQALMLNRDAGDVPGEAETLFYISKIQSESDSFSTARTTIENALKLIEQIRATVAHPSARASYFATTHKYYEHYVDLLMQLHKQRPSEGLNLIALQASERARARGLLELLIEAHADIRQGVDSSLLEEAQSLQKQLNSKAEYRARLINSPHTAEQETNASKEIETLTADYEKVETKIRQNSPRYVALTQPQPLDTKRIQAQLDSETLLLEYALCDERSYLWLVSTNEIKSYQLPPRKIVESAARTFYELLTKVTDPSNQEVTNAGLQLSQILLAPVARELGRKRLVIVADGALQYLPFAALPDPVAIEKKVPSKNLLIERHEIVNLPSVSVLATLRNDLTGRKRSTKDLIVLADPVFDPTDQRVKRISDNGALQSKSLRQEIPNTGTDQAALDVRAVRDGEQLVRLVNTRQEADRISVLVPNTRARKALDFDANRELVMSGGLNGFRYVHFATHGLLDTIHPELSAIVLSLVDKNGGHRDGFLRANEIYNLNLTADLVVLSACETALGEEVRGEGLVGLTRGFMYAGTPRIIASLWAVTDDSTAKLMVSCYRKMIKQRMRPAGALRLAQMEILKDRKLAAPHYWAAFVLQGEWR